MNYNKILPSILDRIIKINSKGYHITLKHKHKRIYNWIIDRTVNINPNSSIGERIYWIVNGYYNYPKCKECGNKLTKFRDYFRGYGDFCSLKCTNNNDCIHKKRLTTSINKYGKDNINNRKAASKTMKNKYGVDYYVKAKDFNKKSLDTIHKKYGDEITNVFQSKEIKEKSKTTKFEKYGNPFYTNVEKLKQTVHNFSKEKKNEIKIKHIKFNREHYGVDYHLQRSEIKEKIKETNRLRYGYNYPIQSPNFRKSVMKKYTYNGVTFSSKPEIAYYIWLTDNNIKFEYEPDVRFEYEFENKIRYYHPDFYLIKENVFVEIKGDQFFNDDGIMKNPYDDNQNGIYESKHQCMIKNGVKIITSAEYSVYLQYVQEKYGKKYLDQFKNK